MVTRQTLGEQIVVGDLLITQMLDSASIVGGVYTMGYDDCYVLTNDLWKQRAGGIPQHCFLLATAMVPGTTPHQDDEEIILLRVLGPASLPAEAELVHVRAEAMREMVVTHGEEAAAATPAILDVLTRNEIQFSAIKAKVLGTFFETEVNGSPLVIFGSDVETFYSSSRYKVYKPYGRSLELIASYPVVNEQEAVEREDPALEPRRIPIGTVRYSSSTRRRRLGTDTPVRVSVNVADFIALKTAVFGMTRLGKSNTMKTIATAVFQYAAETDQNIGQLLFDPAGEYANVNVQDQTALAQIGTEFVTIFRYGVRGDEEGIRPLSSNLYSDETIEVTWSIVTAYLSPRNQSNYIQAFLSADVVGPADLQDDPSAFRRAARRRSALFATFLKAGLTPPINFRSRFAVNASVLAIVNGHITGRGRTALTADERGNASLTAAQLSDFWDAVAANSGDQDVVQWLDPQLDAILALYRGSVGSGYRLLQPLNRFHLPTRTDDYADEILSELTSGKIVIVDLSLGTESVLQFCSERIVNHIMQDSARRFAAGEPPHQIQIYIEEAHRLFNRDRMSVPEERDPYVRLAKEAAKYRIGLIYATQEVSSVDPIILSNTSNWVVTHLNNTSEVKELSKYYDFQDFAELTLKAEDVGFARMKTRSGRYIIPVQIDRFEHARIEAARAAGLARARPQGGP
jgi:uncharacterized protein DUF87